MDCSPHAQSVLIILLDSLLASMAFPPAFHRFHGLNFGVLARHLLFQPGGFDFAFPLFADAVDLGPDVLNADPDLPVSRWALLPQSWHSLCVFFFCSCGRWQSRRPFHFDVWRS